MPARKTTQQQTKVQQLERKEFLLRRRSIGKYRLSHSSRETAKVFNTTRKVANYWARKEKDPTFHSGTHGGLRWNKFSLEDQQAIRVLLWLKCNQNPTTKLSGYMSHLDHYGYKCSRQYVRNIFAEWKWSWKKPSFKQLLKYTAENRAKYANYVEWIAKQDLHKLKFMDEVHFVAKGQIWKTAFYVGSTNKSRIIAARPDLCLTCGSPSTFGVSQTRALGPIGDNVIMLRGEHFGKSYSVSAICSLNPVDPLYIQAREDSNDQYDFLGFIIQAVVDGYLVPGDTLVLDNCAVHGGLETFDIFSMFLSIFDIQLAYLPAYSPEFNPCELVFAQAKRFLREHRDQNIALFVDIATAFALVTPDNPHNAQPQNQPRKVVHLTFSHSRLIYIAVKLEIEDALYSKTVLTFGDQFLALVTFSVINVHTYVFLRHTQRSREVLPDFQSMKYTTRILAHLQNWREKKNQKNDTVIIITKDKETLKIKKQ